MNAPAIRVDLFRPRLSVVIGATMANAPAGGNLRGEKDAGNVMAEHTSAVTNEQIASGIAMLADQVGARVPEIRVSERHALCFDLLMAANAALRGCYAGREKKILRAISVTEQDGEAVSTYPLDRQIEAGRLGELVGIQLTIVPYFDPEKRAYSFPLDGEQHRKFVADMVLQALVARLKVSSVWKKNLPEDWNSDAKHATALAVIEKVLLSYPDHTLWFGLRAKIIRQYLDAVGMDDNLFRNDWFDNEPAWNSSV